MGATMSGPMFEPAEYGPFRSVHGKTGAHYNIFAVKAEDGMDSLRMLFPDGEANELNFVLFSTSGVHGSYGTIEDCAKEMRKKRRDPEDGDPSVTFLIVQPRIVCLRYGNCKPQNDADIAYLKKLRASSWKAIKTIG